MIFRPTANNISYVNKNWPDAEWQDGAKHYLDTFIREQIIAQETSLQKKQELLEDDGAYIYKTAPFDHQRKAFLLSRDRNHFALFMEQGTGKTKVAIDTAAYLYGQGRIDALIIIAPNGAHTNWTEEEIPVHMPEWLKHECWIYSAGKVNSKSHKDKYSKLNKRDNCLKVFSFNIEGFSSEKAKKFLEPLLLSNKCLVVVDESHFLKNATSKRTEYLTKICKDAKFKRILTGTPVTKNLIDMYSQMTFLDKNVLGFDSIYTFKGHFCSMGGYENKEIVGYKNIDEFIKLIDGHSYRVTKQECLDLPEKRWRRVKIELTTKQREIYESLLLNYYAELEGKRITAALGITRLLRLQQVICGWFPSDGEDKASRIPGDNPKLEAVLQHCDQIDGKVVIWAAFKNDIKLIEEELANKFGRSSVASYFGETDIDDRVDYRRKFQDLNSDLRYLVCHPKAAGRSITLTACENPIYHSNDYDLEKRLQSEDRTHRIGTTGNVIYTDVEAKKTVDRKIINALRQKKSVADLINQDPLTFFMEDVVDDGKDD